MHVREMTIRDLELIDDDWQRGLYQGLLLNDLGPALVIEDEDGPVCIGSGLIIWPGVAEVSFRLLRKKTNLFALAKVLRRLIKKGVRHFGIWRLQATVEGGFDTGCRFAEFFGFKKEAVLKKHNYNGKDNIMYVRLF